MIGTKPGTSKPGEFRARCNLSRRVPEKKLTPTELREAREAGHPRVFNRHANGGKGRWEITFPACAGFETTDKAAFEKHMLEEHGRPLTYTRGDAETFATSIRAGWRSPAMRVDGKPLAKVAAEQLRACPTCGLHGQVDTTAGELWWDEHLRGCALAAAS